MLHLGNCGGAWLLRLPKLFRECRGGTTAIAAGAILTMLVDTMIPDAFEKAHDMTGLITVAGFLASFILSKLGR